MCFAVAACAHETACDIREYTGDYHRGYEHGSTRAV